MGCRASHRTGGSLMAEHGALGQQSLSGMHRARQGRPQPHLQRIQQSDLPLWPGDREDDARQAGARPHINQPRRHWHRRRLAVPCLARNVCPLLAAATSLPVSLLGRPPLALLLPLLARRRLGGEAAVYGWQQRQAVVDVPLICLLTVGDGCTVHGRRSAEGREHVLGAAGQQPHTYRQGGSSAQRKGAARSPVRFMRWFQSSRMSR